TPLVSMAADPADPWRKAFRWKIPHFPVGDSVEFTFQAVESPTGNYEVALYNADRAIVRRVSGEPASKERTVSIFIGWIGVAAASLGALTSSYFAFRPSPPHPLPSALVELKPSTYSRSQIAQSGCVLTIQSEYKEYKTDTAVVFRVWRAI